VSSSRESWRRNRGRSGRKTGRSANNRRDLRRLMRKRRTLMIFELLSLINGIVKSKILIKR
jgi:hypothetical protein